MPIKYSYLLDTSNYTEENIKNIDKMDQKTIIKTFHKTTPIPTKYVKTSNIKFNITGTVICYDNWQLKNSDSFFLYANENQYQKSAIRFTLINCYYKKNLKEKVNSILKEPLPISKSSDFSEVNIKVTGILYLPKYTKDFVKHEYPYINISDLELVK